MSRIYEDRVLFSPTQRSSFFILRYANNGDVTTAAMFMWGGGLLVLVAFWLAYLLVRLVQKRNRNGRNSSPPGTGRNEGRNRRRTGGETTPPTFDPIGHSFRSGYCKTRRFTRRCGSPAFLARYKAAAPNEEGGGDEFAPETESDDDTPVAPQSP